MPALRKRRTDFAAGDEVLRKANMLASSKPECSAAHAELTVQSMMRVEKLWTWCVSTLSVNQLLPFEPSVQQDQAPTPSARRALSVANRVRQG